MNTDFQATLIFPGTKNHGTRGLTVLTKKLSFTMQKNELGSPICIQIVQNEERINFRFFKYSQYQINKQDEISTQRGANHERQISKQDQINDQVGAKI